MQGFQSVFFSSAYFVVGSIQRIYDLGNCVLCRSCCRQAPLLFCQRNYSYSCVLAQLLGFDGEGQDEGNHCTAHRLQGLKLQREGQRLQGGYLAAGAIRFVTAV